MSKATLDGKAIALEDAYRPAARILNGAAFPLVAGLGADAAGARAGDLLAERLRAPSIISPRPTRSPIST